MLPWQKKKKEEAMLAAQKEAAETKTTVIGDKTDMNKVVEEVVTENKKEEKVPEIELDQLEIGLVNQHRANIEIKLKTLELLQKILDKLEEINKKA